MSENVRKSLKTIRSFTVRMHRSFNEHCNLSCTLPPNGVFNRIWRAVKPTTIRKACADWKYLRAMHLIERGSDKAVQINFSKNRSLYRGVINYGIIVDLPGEGRRYGKLRMNKYRACRSWKTRLKTLLFPSKWTCEYHSRQWSVTPLHASDLRTSLSRYRLLEFRRKKFIYNHLAFLSARDNRDSLFIQILFHLPIEKFGIIFREQISYRGDLDLKIENPDK